MITLLLTDNEAKRLWKYLEKRDNKDPDLARIHYKLYALMKRPACKRKYNHEEPRNPFMWDPPDE